MAVVRHYSIKNSPLALLKYITGETKAQKAEIITGINCSEEPESAYMEMALCYENYAGEKFYRTSAPTEKEHLKMHHYVISFKGNEVTPQDADKIVQKWAYDVFGKDRQILLATHTDTKNIHVHVAVNAFSMNGKRWLDNKSTIKLCRDKINKLCKERHLDVIENPKWKANQNYAEWLARQNGTSWKEKLCDDIDRLILQDNVKSIDDLANELRKIGYEVTQKKYLSVKPANQKKRKAVRTLRLGNGYGLEELQYRIENKDNEMSLDKVLSYAGIQRDYALCLRRIQIDFYRKSRSAENITYSEIRRNADLLFYIRDNQIYSKEDFEKHVNEIAERTDKVINRYKELREKIEKYKLYVEYGRKQLEMRSYKNYFDSPIKLREELGEYCENHSYRVRNRQELDDTVAELNKLKKELADMQGEYEKAAAEKKTVTAQYTTFIRQLETDYEHYLKIAKMELEWHKEELSKPPKKQFSDVVRDMSAWAESVIETERKYKKVEADRNIQPRNYYESR